MFNFPITRICNAKILIQCYIWPWREVVQLVSRPKKSIMQDQASDTGASHNLQSYFVHCFFYQGEHWLFGTEYLVGKFYDLANYTVYGTCHVLTSKCAWKDTKSFALKKKNFNPLTPRSDWHETFPYYNINYSAKR